MSFKFERGVIEAAKSRGNALFGVAVREHGSRSNNAVSQTPALDGTTAYRLWNFCVLVGQGHSPADAFAKTFEDD